MKSNDYLSPAVTVLEIKFKGIVCTSTDYNKNSNVKLGFGGTDDEFE